MRSIIAAPIPESVQPLGYNAFAVHKELK